MSQPAAPKSKKKTPKTRKPGPGRLAAGVAPLPANVHPQDVRLDPPPTNRGVERTEFPMKKWENCCRIDYLAFTLWDFPIHENMIEKRNAPRAHSDLISVLDRWHDAEALGLLPDSDRYFDLASVVDEAAQAAADEAREMEGKTRWTPDMIPELIGLPDLKPQKMPRGLQGYRDCHMVGSCRVLSGGKPGMGIHVILSGEALADLSINPLVLVRRVLATRGRFSRVDLAIDEFSGLLVIEKMIQSAKAGRCKTRLQEGGVYESFRLATGEHTGLTFYLGNRESDVFFRFYDKLLESLKKGIEPKDLPASWVRAEAELKGHAAQKAARLLVCSSRCDENGNPIPGNIPVSELAPGIFHHYMTFCAPTRDTNRSRWKPAPWWTKWLQVKRRHSVSRAVPKSTMISRLKWFKKQCGPSMSGIAEAFGVDTLEEIFNDGMNRQSEDLRSDVAAMKARRLAGLPLDPPHEHLPDPFAPEAAPEPAAPAPAPAPDPLPAPTPERLAAEARQREHMEKLKNEKKQQDDYEKYRMRSKIEALEAQLHELKGMNLCKPTPRPENITQAAK